MKVRGNWGVEIVDTIGVYLGKQKKFRGYGYDRLEGYKMGCGC